MFSTNITRTRPYTLQSAFSRIWKFFVVEKHGPSLGEDAVSCAYRTEESACAIGCLLPDGTLRDRSQNTVGADTLLQKNAKVRSLLGNIDGDLLMVLQSIHDDAAMENEGLKEFTKQVRTGLKRFAKDNKLAIPA